MHTYSWQLAYLATYASKEAKFLSARYWDESQEFVDEIYLMTTGYGPIINGLAKNTHIILNAQVTAIQYNQHGVWVTSSQGKLQADAVIVTVPLGVLKNNDIQFDPALPATKLNAIKRLQMGLINKIALRFPKIFWPNHYGNFGYLAEHYNSIPFFVNYAHYFNAPVLVGFTSGDIAQEFERYDDRALVDKALQVLQKLFRRSIPAPTAINITRWQADPYSKGAYSCVTLGATSQDYATLAEPINKQLFFAGEATNRLHPATVHGAYLSGLREAERILALYKQL